MIAERMSAEGQWLFKHRGVLPLLLLIPGIWTLTHFRFLGGSHATQQVWDWLCLIVSLSGLLLRATTVGFVGSGTSGRNTQGQRAVELNTTGWYSIVRNPLYLGNYLIMLGIILVPADLALVVVTGCLFWIYYERIISAEEAFLHERFGTAYADWTRRTPVFFPRLSGWVSPARSFNWRMALRREYSAVLLIGIAFILLNFLEHAIVEQRFAIDLPWAVFFLICLTIYVVLRSLKKHTTLLNVQ
jgi:protein-S-isoprenylcysteine O-methyltransferase Ste14